MTDREPAEVTNLDRYGSPPLPWSRPHDLLVASPAQPGTPYFLGTSGARASISDPVTRPPLYPLVSS